ncbi:MAG: ABC transporter substrate-binding protein [bacterium]
MKNLMNRRILLVAGVCGVAMLHCPAYGEPVRHYSSGGQVKVNVSIRDNLIDTIFHIGKGKKYFKKEGLDVRLVPMKGEKTTAFNALVNGTVDVTMLIFSVNNIGPMRESGVRIVAGCTGIVKGKPGYQYYLVRKDLAGGIKTFAALKGRNVAIPSAGTMIHIRLMRELDKAGLSENDFTGRFIPGNLLPAMFVGKAIDVGILEEPLAGRVIRKGLAEVFAGSDISDETAPLAMLYYSGRFMRNKQAARGFMTAYLRSVREFYRATPKEISDIVNKTWGMSIDADVLYRLHAIADGKIDAQSLMSAQEYALKKGWIKTKADEKYIVDSSYIRYANEVLKNEDRAREKARR